MPAAVIIVVIVVAVIVVVVIVVAVAVAVASSKLPLPANHPLQVGLINFVAQRAVLAFPGVVVVAEDLGAAAGPRAVAALVLGGSGD